MKEIVEKILGEEKAAQSRIEAARKESDALIQKARKDALELTRSGAEESAAFADGKREEAQQAFLRQREDILKKVRDEVEAGSEGRARNIPVVAGRIFDKIIAIKE